MLPIRSRPKDQSSDEEENDDEKKMNAVPSSTDHGNEQSVDSNNGSKPVSAVHVDGKEIVLDFSMFARNGTRCGNDPKRGILEQCDALQRLGEALKVHSATNSKEEEQKKGDNEALREFVGSAHRRRFLEDFNHFMERHQKDSVEALKQEMTEQLGLGHCEAAQCPLTLRHFGRRQS